MTQMQSGNIISRIKVWTRRSIRRRLAVLGIIFWILSISLLVGIITLTGQSRMINEANQRNTQLASVVSRDVNAQISNILSDTRTFARRLDTLNTDTRGQAESILALRLASPQRYLAAYYFDIQGNLLFYLNDPLENLVSLSSIDTIISRQVITPPIDVLEVNHQTENIVTISDASFAGIERTPVIYIGIPIGIASDYKRVLVLEVDLRDIWQSIDLITVGQTGFVYMLSPGGLIISHPDEAYIGRKMPTQLQPLIDGYEGTTQYEEPFTKKIVLAAFSPVGGQLKWGIVIQQEKSEVYAGVRTNAILSILILSVLATVGAISIFLLVSNFAKPLVRLTSTVEDITRTGKLKETGMTQNSDEVGQLSRAFDRMVWQLRETARNLAASENKYRSLYESANDAILLLNGKQIIDCNRRAEEMFGRIRDEIVGNSPTEISPQIQPDGQSSMSKADEKLAAALGGRTQFFEWRVIKPDGSVVDAEINLNRFDVEESQLLLAVIRDITERKKSAQMLHESEILFRSIVENSQAGIFTVNSAFRFTYCNDRLCKILGYSREEIIGHDFREFLDEESKTLVAKRYARRQQGEEVAPWYEFGLIRKDGEYRDAELSAAVVRDNSGKPTTVGQILDITERKKTQYELQKTYDELEARVEQRTADLKNANDLLLQEIKQRQETEERLRLSETKYRDLVESANSIILEFDLDGSITFLNRFAREFFGYQEEEILGRHIVGTIVPEVDSAGVDLKEKMNDLFKHPEKYHNNENENVLRNGDRVWIAWTNKEIYDELGTLSHILSIGIDRTEYRKTAAILAQQERESAAVNERTRLARDLHDAVSQTLFSASIIADVLPRLWEKDPEKARKRLEEVRELTRGALAEMRTLLFELRPAALADTDLKDLLNQLAASITGRAKVSVSTQIEGQCELPNDTKVGLYRIAQEALNNVAKHSGANSAMVILRCQQGMAELQVRDDGKGFDLLKIPAKSLGIGIMHERAAAIGVTLQIRSKENEGTEITAIWEDTLKEG
jgi:PAS domain S-box-containing protein